jgi:hypothetical protein
MAYTDEESPEATGSDSAVTLVFRMIEQAENFADTQEKARAKALSYYNADPAATPGAGEGFSSAVSADVRKHVQKLMPSIMRTILGNDRIVEYMPAGPGDEESAAQATDYINGHTVPECDAERALHDAIFDALVVKTGILNWSAYRNKSMVTQEYTGQPPEAMLGLGELGEVTDDTQDEQGLVSFKLSRVVDETKVKLRAVPRGAFLIHPDASSIEDSPIVGERQSITRADLVARGYDKKTVWGIPCEDEDNDPEEMERRGDDYDDVKRDVQKALEKVTIYDVFVRMDTDGDGLAELHHFVAAEGKAEKDNHIVLEHAFATEVPYAEVVSEYEAHQFEGHSVAEDLLHIQDINTTLLRQTLDNVYQVNDPTPWVQLDAIENPDAVYKPKRGEPKILASGRSAAEAVQFPNVPFHADKTFAMMQMMDAEAKERTGISDASGGLPGEALQGMTATAATMVNESAIARAEMIVRNLARGGIRKAFKGLLKLVIAHADQARTVRLRGEWVEVDPRVWDAGMDCVVNVGLGAGSRDRDMMMLQQILGIQQTIMEAFGVDNPVVDALQVYNTIRKIVETAGFASADPFFTKPDPQEIAKKMQAKAQQPSPEQLKAQSQMQIEDKKLQVNMQIKDKEMQVAANKELAQMQADKEIEAERRQTDITLKEMDIAWQREKLLIEQRAILAPQGLDISPDGNPVNPALQGISAMMQQTQQMLALLIQQMQSANAPKRVVRDAAGEVVGLEPVVMN